MAGHFRFNVWDPLLILAQMASMQSLFYISLGIWTILVDLLTREPFTLDHFFSIQVINMKDVHGILVVITFVLNAFTGSLLLWWVVGRTKQCLDFASTVHLFHLVGCWAYSGAFPVSLSWWLLQAACLTLTCVMGEFLCLRSELRAIPLGMGPKADL